MDATPSLQGLRLMLVEDETLVAMMLEGMLDDFGCVVTEVAGTLPRALAITDHPSITFDGAILDVNLGGDKVYPVATRLAELGVPFIFSTGYGPAGLAADFAHVPTLTKPYLPHELENLLKSVMVDAQGRC